MTRRERTATLLAALATILALIVFAATFVRAALYVPEENELAPTAEASSSAPINFVGPNELPDRFQIPVIKVDAKVQQVGVTEENRMGVPNNFTDVAWYKFGAIPGQIGSAVIDGHVDNGLGLPGVFKRLGDVVIGDDIFVVTKEGTRLRFVVTDTHKYPYRSVPLSTILSRSDGAWLSIITCEGNWIKDEETYDQRLVVYARFAGVATFER